MEDNWYAVYTKPRWEKKVAEALTTLQVQNYCPLNKVVHQWSDRKKIVNEPLFTSYVFVKTAEKLLGNLKRVNGIISLVQWLGKPAVIRDEEITIIRQFLKEHSNVKTEKTTVKINAPVTVINGPLMQQQGTIMGIKNNTVSVLLPSLGFAMYVELEKSSIELIQQ